MSTLKRGLVVIATALVVLFMIITFNQIVALYHNLATVNTLLAIVLTVAVSVFFIGIMAVPIYAFVRYPRMAELPATEDGDAYQQFINVQLARLKKNKALLKEGYVFAGDTPQEQVERGYAKLKTLTHQMIQRDANAVFLTTSISQNGVLDGATVLITLVKMIYGIATTYESRPSFTRIVYLYGQIASVVLIARSIEDLDLIEEQLEPILTSLLGGSVVSMVPGAVGITTLVVNSIVEGSVNALLTLRVGVIAQRFMSSMTAVDKHTLRRGASTEAAGHLGSIIANNAKFIIKSVSHATKKATVDKIKWPWIRAEATK